MPVMERGSDPWVLVTMQVVILKVVVLVEVVVLWTVVRIVVSHGVRMSVGRYSKKVLVVDLVDV